MRKVMLLLLFVFSIISMQTVYAQLYSFDLEVSPIRTEIFMNEPAIFQLMITNNDDEPATIRFVAEAFEEWSVQTDPISHRLSGLTLEPHETQTTTLLLHPRNIKPGRKAVIIVIKKDDSNEQITSQLKVNVRERFKIPIIEPKLELIITFSDEARFDPRDENLVQVEIKNKNQLDIKDLSLQLTSSLINEERTGILLQPLERRRETFLINMDPQQEPVRDSLVVTAKVENKSFVEIGNYEIVPYTIPFNQLSNQEESFLRTKTTIEVRNSANARHVDGVRYGTGFWRGIFTTSKPKSDVVQISGARFLEWQVELESGDTTQLVVDVNYRPLFYLIILSIIGSIVYILLRSQLVLKKSVMRVARKEGGISEIKVVMHVRNRGNTPIRNVRIVDKIPNIASIAKRYEVGTLHPSSVIRHSKGATLLKWEIESLEPQEERVINYTIKSRLTILGQFMLPVSVGKYKDAKGKTGKTRSNVLRLSA